MAVDIGKPHFHSWNQGPDCQITGSRCKKGLRFSTILKRRILQNSATSSSLWIRSSNQVQRKRLLHYHRGQKPGIYPFLACTIHGNLTKSEVFLTLQWFSIATL
ncbi:hypothetical protein DPMN_066033 [Dreissena polymorpha]|uniref:Uncharacterized protein n=1 Tax=Dreissena polymorpha TaxID=45954 RepID=A0A9D3YX19_DREPO|nr:hypothetical protein DPMN_066033 [Dreissena polymorpha]